MSDKPTGLPIQHSAAFRRRRFLNWFPMGLTYAMLYMGRYNLTVAANSISALTKEDFGIIFAAGTVVYAFSFLINGPLTDKIGGRKAILIGAFGSGVANLLIGLFLRQMAIDPKSLPCPLVPSLSLLYAINMYFQSYGAVAIVKVNAHWFHVRERGGFSGIFGTMISSGIFFAFTVNGWVLDWTRTFNDNGQTSPWFAFFLPSGILFALFIVEFFLLKDSPGLAGHKDFDTGDASSGEDQDKKVPVMEVFKKILTNPIILTVAFIEFCTGVLRNGVMHWFPFYTKEVWALPPDHFLRRGSWGHYYYIVGLFALAAVFFVAAALIKNKKRRPWLIISGALLALLPFFQAGWGGLLMVAGILGGNVAGWVSDLFFDSRRAPAAGGLYLGLAICSLIMIFVLGGTTNKIDWVSKKRSDHPFKVGDKILSVNGKKKMEDWTDISHAVACIPSKCEGEGIEWDTKNCICTCDPAETKDGLTLSSGTIKFAIERDGKKMEVAWKDPKATAQAGDKRVLPAGPELTLNPYFLGVLVFLISLCVIGTHGLLSGTATMDFGGRKAAATAVGMIDGFVYLGTAVQSICLGFLTTKDWVYWPIFLLPFSVLGFYLLTRIWNAKPKGK